MLRPIQLSGEVTLSSDREAPSDVAAHCAKEGVKGNNNRCRQCPPGTMTTTSRDGTSHDDGRDWEAGGSDMGCFSTTVHSNRRLVRSPTDHFKRLLDEACTNHAYPVRPKLKNYRMM
jgi:hypothetical protein